MRVMVHKAHEGQHSVTVLPSPRAHLPPVHIRGSSAAEVIEKSLPVFAAVAAEERKAREGVGE